jgi:hypothetical protein
MANPHHIYMLLYNMTYLGTEQWHESTQHLPIIPSIPTIDKNEETVLIACNSNLTHKTRHIKQHFHHVHQDQQDSTHQLHWKPCESQLADIPTKAQESSNIDLHIIDKIFYTLPTLIFTSLTRSSIPYPITCYNLLTNQQRFDSRVVKDIQYCYVYKLHISPSQTTVTRVHSTLHLCSRKQCNTARLESKLTSIQIMFISTHEIEH